jgi:hypothetical protein
MSAERKLQTAEQAAPETEEPFALRQQVAERLAAHRSRRPRSNELDQPAERSPRARSSRIAATVAERYAQTKSYHAYLAEEAERAVREAEQAARQAEAAAEIAARNAEALAQVQYDLLTELDQYADTSQPFVSQPSASGPQLANPRSSFEPSAEIPTTAELDLAPPPVNYTVRHADDLRLASAEASTSAYRTARESHSQAPRSLDPTDFLFLDEEIAFRQTPVFEPVEPPVEIPGNLIEFPRQLVASRRARPRLAEGPLREEAELHSDPSQLRIFEVEAEQISPEPATETSAPEWSSILLDAHPRQRSAGYSAHVIEQTAAHSAEYYAPAAQPQAAQHLQLSPETQHLYAAPLQVAPIQLRLMAATVDLCIVLAAFMVFAATAVFTASHFSPAGVHTDLATAAISSVGTIALLGLIYQLLFFTFTDATPGMRYARIALCTFADDNPSRSAMRRRILALVLSSASLGLGVLWALLDDERLGWHDRISRIYQRSY